MTYEGYVFLVCLIVFLTFTILFTFVIALIVKMKLKMIRNGLEDEEIKKEEENKANASRFGLILSKTITSVLAIVLAVAFAFSLYLNFTEGKAANGIPSLKVVRTSSMAEKNKNNKYLEKNSLDDQIQAFDMIVTRHLPSEEDLKLYDIVVYKKGDAYIIHRIVGIEEPNEKHPDCRHFLLQGDANAVPDEFPVLYSQMIGIYQGERIAYVGTFVLFLQSPAGYLCLLLVAFAIIATPLEEKKLQIAKDERIEIIKQAKLDKEKGIIVKAFLVRDEEEFRSSIEREKEQGGVPVSFERIKRVAEMGIEQEDETVLETEKENQTKRSKIKTR